jgi:hypothetical protein
MRNLLAVAAIALAACSSSAPATSKQQARIPEPEFELRQLVGPAESNYVQGPFEVKFLLDIGNRADFPITLSRVELTVVNPPGGAYTLERRPYVMKKTIEAHKAASIELWAKATGYGETRRSREPVSIRGTLYFETPNGGYRHVFVKELGQYPGQND